MPVPNSPNFSLQTVLNEIAGTQTPNSLAGCFTSADPGGFDPTYQGSKDRLSNFRNYNDTPTSLVIFPGSRSVPSGGETFNISISTTGNPSWTVSDSALWISVTPTSGTGNGTLSVTVQSNSTQSQRFGSVTVSWSGTNRSCSITQATGGIQ